MSEAIKIPGTSYSVQLGFESKYYAVYLVQYGKPIKSQKLAILKGTPIDDLPEETEKALQNLLETEQIFINPVIVDRVVNDLIEQKPEEGEITLESEKEEPKEERLVPTNINVKNMISQRDSQVGKTSMIEHKPKEKSKFDASALDFGTHKPKPPKPLLSRFQATESSVSPSLSITPKKETVALKVEPYKPSETKSDVVSNQINELMEKIAKNNKEIKNLKRQVSTLKKTVKELTIQKEE